MGIGATDFTPPSEDRLPIRDVFSLLDVPSKEETTDSPSTRRSKALRKFSKRKRIEEKSASPVTSLKFALPTEKLELTPPRSIPGLEKEILEKLEMLHTLSKEHAERAIAQTRAKSLEEEKRYKLKQQELSHVESNGFLIDTAQSIFNSGTAALAIQSGVSLCFTGPFGILAGVEMALAGTTTLGCEVLKRSGYDSPFLDKIHMISSAASLIGGGGAMAAGKVATSIAGKVGNALLIFARQGTKAASATMKRHKEELGALSAGVEAKLESHNDTLRLGQKELELIEDAYMFNLTIIVRAINNELLVLRRANGDQRG